MTPDAVTVFTEYFGQPSRLYAVLAVLLFVVLGMTWMKISIKVYKERGDRGVNDAHVVGVVLRGLLLMLILTAVFYQNP